MEIFKMCYAYSLSSPFDKISFSASLTEFKTKGLPQSVLYAPTPKLILFGNLSFLKLSVNPR